MSDFVPVETVGGFTPPSIPTELAVDTVLPPEPGIARSLDLLHAAERANVQLKVGTLAIVDHGPRDASIGWRQRRALHAARDVILGDVLAEQAEQSKEAELADWLQTVNPAEVHIVTDLTTDETMFEHFGLTAGEEHIDLGHHFNFDFDSPALAGLPVEVRDHLVRKREYWRPFGIDNAVKLEEFIEEHFERIIFDPANDDPASIQELPVEVQWLQKHDPARYQTLVARHQAGDAIVLRRLKQTPEQLLDATKRIAIHSQRKFYRTWLPQLILSSTEPVILESDRAALHTLSEEYQHVLDAQYGKGKLDLFMYQLLRSQTVSKIERDANFEDHLDILKRMRELGLGIEVWPLHEDVDSAAADDIRALNVALQENLGDEFALRKLMHDAAHSDAEGSLRLLYAIPAFVAVAFGMEHSGVEALAKTATAAGPGDDALMEAAIILAMLQKGFRGGDIIKQRALPMLLAAAGSVALASQVETIGDHAGWHVAALVYAVTTVFTSSMSHVMNARTLAKDYDILVQEGKVRGRSQNGDAADRAEFEDALREAVEGDKSHEEIMDSLRPVMDKLLRNAGTSPRKIESTLKVLEEMVRQGQTDNALENYQLPGRRERYTESVKELLETNPTYKSIIATILASPVLAFALGPLLLAQPFIYVPYGAAESLGGIAGAAVGKLRFNSKWEADVRARIKTMAPVAY